MFEAIFLFAPLTAATFRGAMCPLWLQCFFMTPCAGQTPHPNGSICAALVAATFLCGAMQDANSASPQLNDKLDARDLMLLPSTFLAVNGAIFQMPKASSRSRKTRPCKIFLVCRFEIEGGSPIRRIPRQWRILDLPGGIVVGGGRGEVWWFGVGGR